MLDAYDRRKPLEVFHSGIIAGRITKHAPDQMRVRVDESRQKSDVAEIDQLRICWYAHRVCCANSSDRVVSDYDDCVVDRCGAGSVNQARGLDYNDALPYWSFRSDTRKLRQR